MQVQGCLRQTGKMPRLIWWNSTNCSRSVNSVRPSSIVQKIPSSSSSYRDTKKNTPRWKGLMYATTGSTVQIWCTMRNDDLREWLCSVWSSFYNTGTTQSTSCAAYCHESKTSCRERRKPYKYNFTVQTYISKTLEMILTRPPDPAPPIAFQLQLETSPHGTTAESDEPL